MLSEIQKQISDLIAENQKGSTAVFECEKALAEAEYELDQIESRAFIGSDGTVADRQAQSRLKASPVRLQRDLRRAELNRVKVKIKAIETALIAMAVQVKLMQSEMRL